MSDQLLAAFDGPVNVSLSNRLLLFSGRERGNGRPLRVYLAGFEGPLPSNCADAELYALNDRERDTAGKARAWRLLAGNLDLQLPARSIHIHRPASDRFFAAVPGAERTLKARLGWALLLNLLRLPGAARLLTFIRSR